MTASRGRTERVADAANGSSPPFFPYHWPESGTPQSHDRHPAPPRHPSRNASLASGANLRVMGWRLEGELHGQPIAIE
jgi:hypothetical protein